MKFLGKVGNVLINKLLIFIGNPDHFLDTGIVFWIRHYWEIWKVVSTDCAARCCSARHALAGIAVATMTSLRHQATTDSYATIGRYRKWLVDIEPFAGWRDWYYYTGKTCIGAGMHCPSASS